MALIAYLGGGFGMLCLILVFWSFAKLRKFGNELAQSEVKVRKLTEDNLRLEEANKGLEKNLAIVSEERDDLAMSPDGIILKNLKEDKRRLEEANGGLEKRLAEVTEQLDDRDRKIQKIKNENRELEDDLGQRIRKLKENNLRLEKTNGDLEKARGDLEKNLAKVSEERDYLAKNNQQRATTISFVQDVLSAKELGEYGGLRQKVEELYRYIAVDKDGLDACLRRCGFSDKDGNGELERWKAIASKPWLDGKKVVAFIGEFSAGKTSIVNAILANGKQDSIRLPVSTRATTAIPTYIAGVSNDETALYSFVAPGDIRKGISEESFRNVSKETLEDIRGISSLIKYFVVGYDNQELAGLSILDTPGFSSNDPEDTKRTAEVINECDALFWVIDINVGDFNESSKKTLNAICGKVSIPLYVVLNKADSKSPGEVEATREKVRQTFAAAGMTVADIFPFSTKDPQKYKVEDLLTRIGSVVSRNIGNSHFMDDLKDKLKEHSQEMERQVKNVQNENTEADKTCYELDTQMKKSIGDLRALMDEICQIPQYETHFWSSAKYEMTIEKYNEMKRKLNKAKKDFDKLKACYEKRTGATRDAKGTYEKLKMLIDKKNDLMACKRKVETLSSDLSALQVAQSGIVGNDTGGNQQPAVDNRGE